MFDPVDECQKTEIQAAKEWYWFFLCAVEYMYKELCVGFEAKEFRFAGKFNEHHIDEYIVWHKYYQFGST